MKISDYKAIIIGGGWSGIEASTTLARMLKNHKVLLLTHNIETVGQLSCNTSWGATGRSVLSVECENLGSKLLLACDKSSLQTKILGKSSGKAMWATRVQLDRQLFKMNIRKMVEEQTNLHVFQQEVEDIILQGNKVVGVRTKLGIEFMAEAVIITAGTFLNGKLHTGLQNTSGGRAGDPASISLASRLKELNIPMGRLKTGTPPRLDGRTIDFSKLTPEYGDGHETGDYAVFSQFGHKSMHPKQIPNWVTRTNQKTHDIFRASFDESPMFNKTLEDGITGKGPRYCMSLETKIDRFADKDSHIITLEPEGLNVHEYYPNGISTSLPFHAQYAAIRSIEGLENAHITTPGYAVEYDYYHPCELKSTLESKHINGLWMSGAINGSSGYLEAQSQGAVAGLNAGLRILGKDSWVPSRSEAYMGVLVDDMTTKTDLFEEPYRMFTSKAEYRLYLREDNADQRLTAKGRELGLVGDEQWEFFCKKQEAIALYEEKMKSTWINPGMISKEVALKELGTEISHEYSLNELIKRPQVTFSHIQNLVATANLDKELLPEFITEKYGAELGKVITDQVETTIKYSGYIDKQKEEIAKLNASEGIKLPENFDYNAITSLSTEVKEKLTKLRPETLGQASRISGIPPSAIGILMLYLKKMGMKVH